MGVMLEAFCDLTDFDALAGFDTVQEVYAPWHALEEQSLSGRLLTNIFAGGTVDTEWGFLTGASEHDEYRGAVGSYVRYFTAQGYAAHLNVSSSRDVPYFLVISEPNIVPSERLVFVTSISMLFLIFLSSAFPSFFIRTVSSIVFSSKLYGVLFA